MDFEKWKDTFKPITNPNTPPDEEETILFETYGADLDYVIKASTISPKRIWTLIEGGGEEWISNGYHRINRIAYFITEVPFTKDSRRKPTNFSRWMNPYYIIQLTVV